MPDHYRAKGDLEAARRDFLTFLRLADQSQHPKAFKAARKWIAHIESLIDKAGGTVAAPS